MLLKNLLISGAILILYSYPVLSQSNAEISRRNYIENYKDMAIKEMLRSGVPASITLAQGMLESDNGNSTLARKGNNHFGIKCHSDWKGPTMFHDDDKKGECFRKYKTAYESYQDHSDFLMSGSRYSFLFELEMTDYKGWARGLKKAGYATNPSYAEKLIKIIEDNELHQYDIKGAAEAGRQKTRKTSIKNSGSSSGGREVLERNRVRYIIVKADDNFRSLQEEFDLLPFEIYKYNDMGRDEELTVGQVLYLQPKRNKAEAGTLWHTVKPGESMQMISQMYAVKPEKLYEKNLMIPGQELKPGTKLSLRKQLKGVKPKIEKPKKEAEEDEDNDGELRFEFDY